MIIGVDTGGTFTDLVCFHQGRLTSYKLPSSPDDFSNAVLNGISFFLEQVDEPFELIHSTTVATNALLEKKGAKTALLVTKGFRDVLTLGRQARPDIYQLHVAPRETLIPRNLRREVEERVSSEGKVLVEPDEAEIEKQLLALQKLGVESLAVCFLFSFLKPKHEKLVGRLARKLGLPVSLSSEVLPEFREYERMCATVANAYVSPVMKDYLGRLSRKARGLGAERVRIVQSNGGCLSAKAAGSHAVSTLLSGPAAGVTAALAMARQAFGQKDVKLITFDMGGTSTDVSLLDGDFKVSTELSLEDMPIAVPMMDIHTVGAGGGSIAYADMGGGLQVGPESAGASPGPACYGVGDQPTVTDANLFLRRLAPSFFLDGRLAIDSKRSQGAIERLSNALKLKADEAARGIIRLVNANMERAIRVISVERGFNPREFTLVSFGGAGGLHACELAEALEMKQVLIPANPGVLSAYGAVCGDVMKDFSRTYMDSLNEKVMVQVERLFNQLESAGRKALLDEGIAEQGVELNRSVDLRYQGQSFELNIPFTAGLDRLRQRFHDAHFQRYGHAEASEPIELVNVRVRAIGRVPTPEMPRIGRRKKNDETIQIDSSEAAYPLFRREAFRQGDQCEGPAIIVEKFSTIYLPEHWSARADEWGNLILEFGA